MDESTSARAGDRTAARGPGAPGNGEFRLDDLAARLRGELALEAAGTGTFDWDLVTGELDWDERLLQIFGYGPDEGFDRSIEGFNARVHPDDLPDVSAALQSAIRTCGDFDAVYRVVLPDGGTRWVSARGRALCDEGGTAGRLLGVASDVTEQRGGDLRVARVLEAMPAGFYSLDGEWRFTYVNAEAERLLGRGRDELLGAVIWEAFPAAQGSIFEESYRRAVASQQPVTFDAYYPPPLDGWYELRAWPSPEGLSVYFLEVTDRRRAEVEAQRAGARLALLAQVSSELAASLTADVATRRIPRLTVPTLADACIVSVLDGHGHPRAVGTWHRDPNARSLLARYGRARLEALPTIAPVARSFETGEAIDVTGEEALRLTPEGEARELLTELGPTSAVALPLRGRGRTLGLLSLLYEKGRRPADGDLATAQDVADRTGLALDNARLYGQQQQLALQLQRSMLTAPPEPDHAEIVVRYLPAAEAAAVGGDWYDAFLQSDGATMLVIGDVAGHDTAAAATMGQLRSLLRGIATSSDAGPADLLRKLDSSMSLLQVRTLATAAVARFEQTPDELARGVTRMRWANAGHPPPFVVTPAGEVTVLATVPAERLLGVDPDVPRTESVVSLDRDATVLLYTDGLVERRDADLDSGLAQLRAALSELAHLPLGELCDAVLDRLVHGRPDDDVALVAVRLHRQDRPRPAEAGPNRVPDEVPSDRATGS
ncbi:SpoIIE family protein phosphatase [Geodermatophilus sp. SYSU D00815]